MAQTKKKKCRHCKRLFSSDPRNLKRQKYCPRPECRKASKAKSQKRWLEKPENRHYFRGPEHVRRVQEWRKKNPGYWKRKKPPSGKSALQDSLNQENHEISNRYVDVALQDVLKSQGPVLIGLIAGFTGITLQDDIAESIRRMRQLGQDIINHSKGGGNDLKTSYLPQPRSPDAGTVQLGGPSPGS
ncbi:conserved hypothetical protein [Candidatus Desulfarcum epimagneticum]|uniref:Uncharacterized protein n=1 Tax=uncultured Desulfobacteraceae bacterium TaxID=218296 RepID=A0A484HI30_9BACT|nr:conserved hypothetical protein [uncultured Desulfobacteraceae bacterium]